MCSMSSLQDSVPIFNIGVFMMILVVGWLGKGERGGGDDTGFRIGLKRLCLPIFLLICKENHKMYKVNFKFYKYYESKYYFQYFS